MNFPGSSALVGRAAEVAVLAGAVGDARTQVVLIAGEAGLGKTRLVGEFTERLDRDVLTVTGRCPEFGTEGVAFAPFLAVLRGLVRWLGAPAVAGLLPPNPALANWLPQVAAHTGPAGGEADRLRLFGEILTVLEQSAMTRPLVLILEDLHWADDATRELLAFLITNLADGETLIVCTYRPGEAGALRPLLAELRRNPAVRQLDLPPLTRHEVGRQLAALLGREPESALITTVFERSGGNPLFVEALGRSPGHIPEDLTELLLAFQSGLTPDARTVLQLAAVIGSSIRHELLCTASNLPDRRLHAALRELVTRHLLLTTDTGYEFRHVLIRQAVYDDLLPGERTRFHAAITEALHSTADSPTPEHTAELAHHATASGDIPRALTAAWMTATHPAATHPEQLRQLERIRDLWDRLPESADLLGTTKSAVLERIVETAVASGAVESGISAADAALALAVPESAGARAEIALSGDAAPERVARLYRHRAYLRSRTVDGPGDDLDQALRLLPEDRPSLERAQVLVQVAATRMFAGDAAVATACARAALELADQFTGVSNSVVARANAYLGLAAAEEIDTALEYFAAARTAATAASDVRVLIDVATWESAVLVAAGRHEDAIVVVQRGIRVAHEAFRFHENAPILLVKWAQALTALGRWAQARELVDEAQFEQLPSLSRAALLVCYAEIASAQGDTDAARRDAELAATLLGEARWTLPYRLRLHVVRCRIALGIGDQSGAAGILAGIAAVEDSIAALVAHPQEVWPLVVCAAQVQGAPRTLRELAGVLPAQTPVTEAHRLVFAAHLSGSSADWERAAGAWRAVHQPYDAALSQFYAARALVAEGNRVEAEKALRDVAAASADLGAVPLLESATNVARRARIALDDKASTVAAASVPAGPLGAVLTARELEVLRLVAEGLSNRALAAELFISANTAGVHVSRILTKLGVASRTQAAAYAHAHGLLRS